MATQGNRGSRVTPLRRRLRALMRIEAARAVVDRIPLPPAATEELRRRARLRSTHYSTQIEGNRLTREEATRIIEGQPVEAAGRERDVQEVQNYWNAFLQMEAWVAQRRPLTEELIRKLHALVENGRRAKPTPRTGREPTRYRKFIGSAIPRPTLIAVAPHSLGMAVGSQGDSALAGLYIDGNEELDKPFG